MTDRPTTDSHNHFENFKWPQLCKGSSYPRHICF